MRSFCQSQVGALSLLLGIDTRQQMRCDGTSHGLPVAFHSDICPYPIIGVKNGMGSPEPGGLKRTLGLQLA